jgi:hypothetical protein
MDRDPHDSAPAPVVLPTIHEGETPPDFNLRAERDVLDLLEGMGIEEAPIIKERVQQLDEEKGQPVGLAALEGLYERSRLEEPDSVKNRSLEKLSITSSAVANLASLIAISVTTDPDDPGRARATYAVGKKMDEALAKDMHDIYSALGRILTEALQLPGPAGLSDA